MSTKVQLQTERLLLRVYEEKDIPAIVPLLGAREVAAMTLRIPHPYREADAREYLQRLNSAPVPSSFGLFDRNTGELYGGMGLMLDEQNCAALPYNP